MTGERFGLRELVPSTYRRKRTASPEHLHRQYLRQTKRKGFVVALSGGIDSSVTAALCVHALGPERVFGLHMPEQVSSPETIELSTAVSDAFQIDSVLEEITQLLRGGRLLHPVRRGRCGRSFPAYGPGWKSKIVLPSVTDSDALRLYSIVVEDPDGHPRTGIGCRPARTWGSLPRRTSSSGCAR